MLNLLVSILRCLSVHRLSCLQGWGWDFINEEYCDNKFGICAPFHD